MALKYGKGVNDMPRDWYRATPENRRIYDLWSNILRKCYPRYKMDQLEAYKGVAVCEEWLYLSNFYKDIQTFSHYNEWLHQIPSPEGKQYHLVPFTPTYSKDTCSFVTHATRKRWGNINEES